MNCLETLRQRFAAIFGGTPRMFRAPGRVNLIGEHLDYNEGWVLPIAIDRSCHVAARRSDDRVLRIHSEQMQETAECSLDEPQPSQHHWSNYIRGVAWALREAGQSISGADLLVSSEIPLGAGLSSSAALEVAAAFALLHIQDRRIDPVEFARLCQKAENDYVGMRCGIMDQLTACCGRRRNALLIDCRSLTIEYAPIDESAVRIVVANTMAKHALAATSGYNRRREECEEAVKLLRVHFPDMKTLRDASWSEIQPHARNWPDNIRRRAHHVTTEISRVHTAVAALRKQEFEELGRLLSESHQSLDRDFEVSSEELNLMVELAAKLPGFLGARMTGAGFGGCTVNLVRANAAADFSANLAASYEARTGTHPEIFVCRASNGVEEVF